MPANEAVQELVKAALDRIDKYCTRGIKPDRFEAFDELLAQCVVLDTTLARIHLADHAYSTRNRLSNLA